MVKLPEYARKFPIQQEYLTGITSLLRASDLQQRSNLYHEKRQKTIYIVNIQNKINSIGRKDPSFSPSLFKKYFFVVLVHIACSLFEVDLSIFQLDSTI